MRIWHRLIGGRPIVTRLVVAVAASMAMVLVLAAAFVYWRVSFALNRQVDQDLDAYQGVVERALRSGQPPPTQTPGEVFQTYDAEGRLVGGNRVLPPLVDQARFARLRTVNEARFDVGQFLPPPRHAFRVDAFRVPTSTGSRLVAAAISTRKRDEALRELLLQLTFTDLLALLAASFVGYRTARAALDPVERYRRAVERLERDDDEPRGRLPVATGRDDELSRLGDTFNELLSRIETSSRRERQFLADASHELRSPLSLMRAELEWHRHRPRSNAETAAVLASLQSQVTRLVDLANALLDIEELRGTGPLTRDDVDVADMVHEAVRNAGQSANVRVEAPTTRVQVNRRWTELAISNLIGNAHLHGAGTVSVTASVNDGTLSVAVRDKGPGFPPEFAGRAFDRFSRAEQSRTTPGSGLGLSLVQAVARAHGGEVSIDRTTTGACVRIVVPAS